MYLSLGLGSLSLAALVFAWAYGAHRRPNPPAWARHESLTVAVTLLIVALSPVAAGGFAAAALDPATTLATLEPVGAGIALALAVIAVVAVPRLLRPARAAAEAPPMPAPAPRPPARPGPAGSSPAAPGKRKAA